jgi:hypothetical protein
MKHGSAFGVGLSVEENKAQSLESSWKMEDGN